MSRPAWSAWFRSRQTLSVLAILLPVSSLGWAGDDPFLVTYTHELEDPGNLEVGTKSVGGNPTDGRRFLGVAAEVEYSVTRWWTTEFYLDGQSTAGQSTLLTGFRWEDRFRLLKREHWINPLLYVEFEDLNGADKSLLEVVGHDGTKSLIQPNRYADHERDREVEAKLILGSSFQGWTIAENLIAGKDVRRGPFEFGYAVAVGRPLAHGSKAGRCTFCASALQSGLEVYGGLGYHNDFGFHGTSQYVAPVVGWTVAKDTIIRVSPTFGVTGASVPFLLRLGVSYEIDEFSRALRSVFHGRANAEAP